MTKYSKGEWTNARYDICEIECDGEVYCTVATKDVDLIIDVLNENEQLKSRIEYLERKIQRERNSTQKQYAKWEKEAETKIKELSKENEQLKKDKMILEHNHLPVMERKIKKYKMNVDALTETNDLLNEKIETLSDENEELKQQKSFLKIIDDYFIKYEDGELFNLHKPSDIRSLMYILNRENGYSELQCEYNDLEECDVE